MRQMRVTSLGTQYFEILVAGATGFIGRGLVQMPKDSGHHVWFATSSDGDIADPDGIRRILNG